MTPAHKDSNGSELIPPDSLGGCRALVIWVPVSAFLMGLVWLGTKL